MESQLLQMLQQYGVPGIFAAVFALWYRGLSDRMYKIIETNTEALTRFSDMGKNLADVMQHNTELVATLLATIKEQGRGGGCHGLSDIQMDLDAFKAKVQADIAHATASIARTHTRAN